MFDRFSAYSPYVLALLRIVAALLFIEHGTQKLFAFPIPPQGGSTVALLSLFGIGALVEFVGGILVLIGLFTRPAAFIMAGQMAVAYWMFHYPNGGFYPVANGGDAAILFCFVFLYIVFAGPGAWSVDRRSNTIA